jgi:hypothetical protein
MSRLRALGWRTLASDQRVAAAAVVAAAQHKRKICTIECVGRYAQITLYVCM